MNENYIETGRKNQKIKTRKKILLSAQDFLSKGKKFTLNDIAHHSGISRATVYRYYSNVELLAGEAGLDLNTDSPEEIYERLKHLDTPEIILGIQEYFNHFTLKNEPALRKYLSAVIANPSPEKMREARRMQTINLALQKSNLKLDKKEIEKLSNISAVLMGMEPFIITKDVCRLNDKKSTETLSWGLKMILQGLLSQK